MGVRSGPAFKRPRRQVCPLKGVTPGIAKANSANGIDPDSAQLIQTIGMT